MVFEAKKALPVSLRSIGLDEKWLQDQIQKDPAILGLGELEIAGREHRQPVGGRIDFLMRDEAETFYEVEIMLGALDESHIIRTIEYWDIERQRRPQSEHRAVIVSEQITARFFNVLRLLNRAVPLIAIKLAAFRFSESDEVVLHAVTVLDIIEEVFDDRSVDPIEHSSLASWEIKSQSALKAVEKVVSLLRNAGIEPSITYNRHHIALRSTGRNFCWFYARKAPKCHVALRVDLEDRESLLLKLQNAGIDASPRGSKSITFGITSVETFNQSTEITEVLKHVEETSR